MNIFNPDNQGSDPQGRYIDRNVAAGIFGTVLNATVFNQIGDENDNLIKAAGLIPSDKEVNQWLKAIQKLYGDADTALKEELVRKIEALTASDIAFDDSISISASDVQNALVALHTLIKALKADEVSFDDSISLGASNVQELGVKLNEKLDTEINDLQTQIDTLTNATIIADGKEHFSGRYYQNADGAKKPIYYRAFEKQFQKNEILNTDSNEWKIDMLLYMNGTILETNNDTITVAPRSTYDIYNSQFVHILSTKKLYYDTAPETLRKGLNPAFYYTKTTDSLEY